MSLFRRRKKLVKPALQLKVILTFLITAMLAVFFQAALLAHALVTPGVEGAEAVISDRMIGMVYDTLLITVAVLVPASLFLGALVTHRIAGPIYRFEMFLRAVMRGEHPQPCKIRTNDELHDFCDLLNEVTEPMRAESADVDESPTSKAA